ncbi:MAG TPA: hypothetical protein VFH15_07565 [Pyrinomonadaceae bacterium]|nr:hypothetical protein [Pyrinomonadaceae bacterium]
MERYSILDLQPLAGSRPKEGVIMIRVLGIVLVIFSLTLVALAQGKGVDKSGERVRDTGASRAPAINGSKTDVGSGRGIDWGKDRTPEIPPIPNPYRLPARRDVIMKAVADVMRDRKLILDETASKPDDGILVSQPYTFIKGAVVSQAELSRYADAPSSDTRGWTRGRYTLTVEVQPIDGASANVAVNARVEGRTDGATGAEWETLPSTGLAEEEFLAALIAAVTGSAPPGRTLQ